MGQAKQRGTYEQRKAEVLRVAEVRRAEDESRRRAEAIAYETSRLSTAAAVRVIADKPTVVVTGAPPRIRGLLPIAAMIAMSMGGDITGRK